MLGVIDRGRRRLGPVARSLRPHVARSLLRVVVRLPYPLRRNPLFDPEWYTQRYPDVARSGGDPYRHYLRHGGAEGRWPNRLLDTRWYRATYPDVAAAGIDPLDHYLVKGAWEGRDPSPAFDSSWYLEANPDVRASAVNPLLHYLRHGEREGRHPRGHDPASVTPVPTARSSNGTTAMSDTGFRTFEEYLRLALTNPNLLRSPYPEAARRVLDYMGWLHDHLAAEYAPRPQDELVSVVIPTYQRADMIRRALDSVTGQSYRNLEIIVVDDGSTDGTEAVVLGVDDDRIRLLRSSQNLGTARARNMGLEAATGTWIAHLDSDDWWDPEFVLISLNQARDKGFEFAYSAQLVLRPVGGPAAERPTTIRFAPFNRSLLENTNYISTIAVIHTRALLERSGMFATDLRRFIDWDLFLRMSRHVTPLAIPVVLSTYDQPSSRISVSLDESRQQNLDAIDRRIRRDAVRHPDGPVPAAISPVGSDAVLEAWRTTTVVIPNYEALAHLRRCVDSVREHSPGTELIIVDNDSGPASQRYLDMLAQEGVRVIRNEANLGFSHAVNQGIAVATADNDIVLLNNDARVTAGWLEAMHDVLARFPEVGIVAPRQVLDAGEPTIRTHVPGADPARACDCNLSAHHRNVLDPSFDPHRGLVELTFAPFFCVLIRRNVVDAIGPLDHIRAPHYRSDRLYCDQVRSFGGHRIVYTPHAIVHHAHQRATRDLQNRDQRLHKAMKDDNDWWELRRLQGLQARTRSAETNGPRSTDRSHAPDPRGVSGRAAITPDAS